MNEDKLIRICTNTEWIMNNVMQDHAVDGDGNCTNELIASVFIEKLVARLDAVEEIEPLTGWTAYHEWNGLHGVPKYGFRECGAIATFDDSIDAELWSKVECAYYAAIKEVEEEVESWEKDAHNE